MKKKLILILTLVLVLALIASVMVACSFFALMDNGNGLEYHLYYGKSYYVVGIGTFTGANLQIPATYRGVPVTSIGDNAFSGCDSIKTVTFEENSQLTSIGESAFSGCSSLESITIPNSVTEIGNYALSWCRSLKSVTFGEDSNLSSIGLAAFICCSSLESITLPNSVVSIGDSAFGDCSSLESITLPFVGATKDGTENTHFGYIFGANDYSDNDDSVPTSIKTVVITDSSSIGSYAFYDCSNLTSITIPNSISIIGGSAFSGCSNLVSITIPSSVTSIGYGAFASCSRLVAVNFGENSQLTSIDAVAFVGCLNLESITIPRGVTEIAGRAFDGCYKLVEIINNSTLNIVAGSDTYGYVAKYAKKVITSSDQSGFIISGDYTFYNANGTYYLVSYNGSETDITLPNSINGSNYAIYEYAFCNNDKITSVVIPDSVTSIGSKAFYNCDSLTSIAIPSSVTSIGSYAFSGCASLNAVYISDIASWCKINFRDYTANPLHSADNLYLNGELVTDLVIPDGVTSIGEYAFYGCASLKSVTFGDNSQLTSIGEYAFCDCHKLVEVINNSTLNIVAGSDTYGYVAKYAKKVITSSDQSGFIISGDYTFYNDNGTYYLVSYNGSETDITLPNSINGSNYAIYECAFCNNDKITSVVIPDSVTSIGLSAFYSCDSLTSIAIPSSVTSIGSYAFSDCDSLTSITIPTSVTSIGSSAFYICDSLTTVYYGGTSEQWADISIDYYNNAPLTRATRYYYSENKPTTEGNFWHYVNGVPTKWE